MLAFKLVALLLLYVLFFGSSHRPEPYTPETIAVHLLSQTPTQSARKP